MFSAVFLLCIGLLAVTRPSESQSARQRDPRVITEPQEFEAEAGSSITLPCNIRNVGRRSVFWFKGDAPEGRELIMQMRSRRGRFVIPSQYEEIIESGKLQTVGSDLIIHRLSGSDTSSYTCSIAWARQSVTHTLTVTGDTPMTVTAVPSDGKISVGESLPATLSCIASWDPPATVSWFKQGETDVLAVGSTLNFFTSHRDDSGQYYCKAENGVAAPVTFNFDFVVEHVEVQAIVSEVVASGEDSMAQLACRITGFPEPQVAWYTSTGPVPEDGRHRIFFQNNIYYLQLHQMTPSDLGEYQCYGYNEKSRDHATIKVTASPGPVTVDTVTYVGDLKYRAQWHVNSLASVRFYHVALREVSSDTVDSLSVPGSATLADGRSLYRGSSDFSVLPGRTYELMVKAVAEEYQPGPDQEEPYIFTVPVTDSQPVAAANSPQSYRGPNPQYREHGARYGNVGSYDNRDNTYNSYGNNYGGQRNPGSVYGEAGSAYAQQDEDYYDVADDATSEVSDEDAWKWWKVTLALVSRLPQLARTLQ